MSSVNSGLYLLDQTTEKLTNTGSYLPAKEYIIKQLVSKGNLTQKCGFTLTLKKLYHDDNDKWLHNYIENTLLNSRCWKDKEYIMFPEYTQKGILHYHGVMYNEYQSEFLRCIKHWRNKFGFAKPELEIKHYDKWIDYITKDYGKTGLWTIYKLKK